jgi:very-short-patch-repair endonuclease
MQARSRQLRREAPVPERILWSLLRNRNLGGFKFRRQQPIGPYVADFFCENARLVVELDGRSHDNQESYDLQRDAYLRGRGIELIRIQNDDLLSNRIAVAEMILAMAEQTAKEPSPQPSPTGRGGA